jgi:hypothetical protein
MAIAGQGRCRHEEDRLPLDEVPQPSVDPLVDLTHRRLSPVSKYET